MSSFSQNFHTMAPDSPTTVHNGTPRNACVLLGCTEAIEPLPVLCFPRSTCTAPIHPQFGTASRPLCRFPTVWLSLESVKYTPKRSVPIISLVYVLFHYSFPYCMLRDGYCCLCALMCHKVAHRRPQCCQAVLLEFRLHSHLHCLHTERLTLLRLTACMTIYTYTFYLALDTFILNFLYVANVLFSQNNFHVSHRTFSQLEGNRRRKRSTLLPLPPVFLLAPS